MTDNGSILETERLILEPFELRHADFILKLVNSPGWLQYIGDRGIKDLAAAEKYILEGPMAAYHQYGYGFSVVCLKNDRTPIGGCGLIRRPGLDWPDIGFALLPEYSGRGYACEVAAATLAHARDELGIGEVLAITLPENTRSIRLLEKIGLHYEKEINLPGDPETLHLYRIALAQ